MALVGDDQRPSLVLDLFASSQISSDPGGPAAYDPIRERTPASIYRGHPNDPRFLGFHVEVVDCAFDQSASG